MNINFDIDYISKQISKCRKESVIDTITQIRDTEEQITVVNDINKKIDEKIISVLEILKTIIEKNKISHVSFIFLLKTILNEKNIHSNDIEITCKRLFLPNYCEKKTIPLI